MTPTLLGHSPLHVLGAVLLHLKAGPFKAEVLPGLLFEWREVEPGKWDIGLYKAPPKL